MTEKRFRSRVINKHDIEANWKLAVNFKPLIGEWIVYDPDENYDYARFKMGDGETFVNDLPFCNDVITEEDVDLMVGYPVGNLPENDQESIVQQVIAALGTPVFGRVEDDKDIILTATNLAAGTYTYYFEDANGERRLIGTDAVAEEPKYTNVIPLSIAADGTQFVGANGEDGYKTGTRINSSGVEVSANTIVTGYIPATVADKFYFYDIDLSADSNKYHKIAIYDENFTFLSGWDVMSMYNAKDSEQVIAEGVSFDENGILATYSPLAFRYAVGSTVVNKTAYIRVCAGTINENSVITKNEPIV